MNETLRDEVSPQHDALVNCSTTPETPNPKPEGLTSSFIRANSSSPLCQIDVVSPRGQSTHSTPICSMSRVFMVLSSKKSISEKGTRLSAFRRSKCLRFEPGKICCNPLVSSSIVTPGAASNLFNKLYAHSTCPVREARATRVSDHSGRDEASSWSAALAPSKSHMSRSAFGARRSWYNSGVHSVLSDNTYNGRRGARGMRTGAV